MQVERGCDPEGYLVMVNGLFRITPGGKNMVALANHTLVVVPREETEYALAGSPIFRHQWLKPLTVTYVVGFPMSCFTT